MAEFNSEIWMNALSDVSDKFNPFNAMVVDMGERVDVLHGYFRYNWCNQVIALMFFNFNVYFNSNKSHKTSLYLVSVAQCNGVGCFICIWSGFGEQQHKNSEL